MLPESHQCGDASFRRTEFSGIWAYNPLIPRPDPLIGQSEKIGFDGAFVPLPVLGGVVDYQDGAGVAAVAIEQRDALRLFRADTDRNIENGRQILTEHQRFPVGPRSARPAENRLRSRLR